MCGTQRKCVVVIVFSVVVFVFPAHLLNTYLFQGILNHNTGALTKCGLEGENRECRRVQLEDNLETQV